MEGFLAVARQVAILFVLMAVGAAMRRLRLLSAEAVGGLVNLLILVVTPCLIVDVFQRPYDPSLLRGLALAFLVSSAVHLVSIAAARALVRHRDGNVRRPLLLAAVFSNAGFMGLPLEQAVLGEAGVFYGAVYVTVFNLFIWSWGVRTMGAEGGAGRVRLAKMAVNPGTFGLALGLPLFFLSWRLPEAVATPVHLLAGLNTPLAMIVIGHCLWGARLGRVVRMGAVYVAAFLRLVGCPLAVLGALAPFRASLDRNLALALVIAASAPAAAMVSMFAAKFGRDVEVSVAVVSGTTFLSVLTMPAVIALALRIF